MFHQEDTGGSKAAGSFKKCGTRVTVLDTFDCHGCWKVRCDDGMELIAYDTELHPIVYAWCSDVDMDLRPEDKVKALVSMGCVEAGKNYVVRSINPDGTLNLSAWKYDLGTVLPGTYDPACFRKMIS